MTENEALKIFENEVTILDCLIEHDKDIIADCGTEDDEFDDNEELAKLSLNDHAARKELFETAITALKEIQQYRKIGTVEYFEKLKLMDNGTIWGFINEYVDYKNIGTVEECREAVEKQEAKKCVIDSCPDHTHYKCPSCGKIHLSRYKHGCPSLGRIPRFCEYCGQAIDENLEGMEDD